MHKSYIPLLFFYSMQSTFPRTMNSARLNMNLPRKTFSELSHLKNIEYCIKQILTHEDMLDEPVVGYLVVRTIGTRHSYHCLIPREEAEQRKKKDSRFDYATLEQFLDKKSDIAKGRYTLTKDGFITGWHY